MTTFIIGSILSNRPGSVHPLLNRAHDDNDEERLVLGVDRPDGGRSFVLSDSIPQQLAAPDIDVCYTRIVLDTPLAGSKRGIEGGNRSAVSSTQISGR